MGLVTAAGADGRWTRTFTDPAFHLGGGVRINVTPHVFIRPELRGLFVTADDDVQSLGAVSVGFGYRF
jgi:opacity protein-like surface antigen